MLGNRTTRLLQYATCIGVLFILVDNQVAESFGCWSFLFVPVGIFMPLIPSVAKDERGICVLLTSRFIHFNLQLPEMIC